MKHIKIYFLLISFIGISNVFSQDSYENTQLIDDDLNYLTIKSIKNTNSSFFNKFSLGIKGGVNFSLIIPYERQSIFSGQDAKNFEKDYEGIQKNIGMQFGFIFMYDITRIVKISLQPGLNDYVYKYKNTYTWAGKTNLQYESEFAHRLRFFELPLIVGVYTTYSSWQPYFQGGIYYGRLLNANSNIKNIEISSNLSGSEQKLEYETGAHTPDLYAKNHYGVLGGAGISYLTGNMRIGLEANYRLLLSNLNTTETQYMNNQIVSGNYDVPDKFKFSNLSISLNLIVSLSSTKPDGRSNGSGSVFCNDY